MRRLIMWNLITLDGFFEGEKKWDLDWHNEVWDAELEGISVQQLKSADMLIFGGTTYEGMAAYWRSAKGEIADLMNNLPKVAISRTLKTADWNGTTLINDNAVPAITKLKEQGDGNMFVFGSGNLSATFISEGIFDEYRLVIVPVILGTGNPLFGHGLSRLRLKLLGSRQLNSGGVILQYAPKQAACLGWMKSAQCKRPNQALQLTDHACKRATVQWAEAKASSKAPASAPAAKRYVGPQQMMKDIRPSLEAWGEAFIPSKAESLTGFRFTEKIEPETIGSKGK